MLATCDKLLLHASEHVTNSYDFAVLFLARKGRDRNNGGQRLPGCNI